MFENFDWIAAMRQSPVMIIILGLSVITLGLAIERALYYWKRRGSPQGVVGQALEQVRQGRMKEAVWTLGAHPHPAGPVSAEVLRHADASVEVIEERLQIALSEQRLRFEKNLGWLGTMGNTAPLIGLLGTVWGIMRAFHDLARTGSAGPSVVAAGIAEALFTTAAGLLVAVPAVMLYNHFVRRMTVMLPEAENHARSLRLAAASGSSNAAELGQAM